LIHLNGGDAGDIENGVGHGFYNLRVIFTRYKASRVPNGEISKSGWVQGGKVDRLTGYLSEKNRRESAENRHRIFYASNICLPEQRKENARVSKLNHPKWFGDKSCMKKEENISRQRRDGMIVPAIIYQIIIPVERLCHNASFTFVVILNEAKNLINSSC
jgi:hypothetical protein